LPAFIQSTGALASRLIPVVGRPGHRLVGLSRVSASGGSRRTGDGRAASSPAKLLVVRWRPAGSTGAGTTRMTLELFLPHGFASDPWWAAFRRLAVTLERPSKEEGVAAYAALARALVAAGPADRAQAIAHGLGTGEPPLAGWVRRQPSSLLSGERELLEHDLTVLCSAARRDLRRETTASVGHELPPLTCLAPVSLAPEVVAMRRALSTEPVTEVL